MKKVSNYAILPLLLVVLAAVVVIYAIARRKAEPITLQGVVRCQTYNASSKIAGRIESLYITEGQAVSRGDTLFTLSTPELNTKLMQAKAADRVARALDSQVTAGARKEQIEAAYNLWQRAVAGARLAEKSYNRTKVLHAKGVVTTQQFDEATAALQSAQAVQSAAHAEYSLLLAGATTEQKRAAAAEVMITQGAVAEVESYIADSRVLSAVSGEVSTIAYRTGEVVGAGHPVATILDLDDTWVEFNIKETLMPHIVIGRVVTAYIPALDRHTELTVSYIAPQADFATWSATSAMGGFDIRTFVVRMRSDDNHLRPGMSAIVKLYSR